MNAGKGGDRSTESINGAVRIAAVNSIDFVRRSFDLHRDGELAAIVRSKADHKRFRRFGAARSMTPRDDKGWARLDFSPADGDRLAQIVSTSGTTGEARSIVLTHGNIAFSTRRLISEMQIDAGIREYVGVPVSYSFGLGRARAVSAAGGAFYIPPDGFSPTEIARMLDKGEINALSAVPTLCRLLLQNADIFANASAALKWLEIGSQSMTAPEKEALKALFPQAIIVQHYGLTEASRATFLKIHEATGDALSSVGKATEPAEIALTADGRVKIRGPHVAKFGCTESGLAPLADEDGWLTTNDAGGIRDGNLHFLGRVDDLINCGGVKLDPELLETEIARRLKAKIGDIAVARLPDSLRGDGMLVSYNSTLRLTDAAIRDAAVAVSTQLGLPAAGGVKTLAVAAFPRTETGKLKRSALAADFLANELSAAETGAPSTPGAIFDELMISDAAVTTEETQPLRDGELERRILAIWSEALGRADISLDESFYDVGGDSLSAVTVALNLERAGMAPELAHGVFDGRTVRELARLHLDLPKGDGSPAPRATGKTDIAVFSEALNFMKGVVVLCMLGSHWAPPYLVAAGRAGGRLFDGLAVFFGLGTPTLAFLFGMGVAVFHARQHKKNASSFRRNVKLGLLLLVFGIFVDLAAEIIVSAASPQPLAPFAILSMSYGPFIYYAFATASLPLWIGLLDGRRKTIVGVLICSAAAYGAYIIAAGNISEYQATHAGDFVYKLAAGRWGLFQMTAISLLGVAAGLAVQDRLDKGGNLNVFGVAGVIFVIAAITAAIATGQWHIWFEFPRHATLSTTLFYSGVTLIVISGFRAIKAWFRHLPQVLEIVCCLGVLLFPLFVLQSVVYRSAFVGHAITNAPFLSLLTMSIAVFCLGAGLLVRRVHRLYYAGR